MTCKCGHTKNEHALQDNIPRECFICGDCLQFKDNASRTPKHSEACDWKSHEFCEDISCECECHVEAKKNMELYG